MKHRELLPLAIASKITQVNGPLEGALRDKCMVVGRRLFFQIGYQISTRVLEL